MRGEYWVGGFHPESPWELPPRARRIPTRLRSLTNPAGTTSACAENTHKHQQTFYILRNYLRVRGEYRRADYEGDFLGELPPRARRIQADKGNAQTLAGTTSACAENTRSYPYCRKSRRNYLRVRGEYLIAFEVALSLVELPPRARRILRRSFLDLYNTGTTSACAENTGRGLLLVVW